MKCLQCGVIIKKERKYCSRKCMAISMLGNPGRTLGKTWKRDTCWNRGMKMSEEFRKKLSDAHKGKKLTEEHKINISKSNKGRKLTEEQKAKLRKYKKENVCYGSKHQRIYSKFGKADVCETCGSTKKVSWSNKDHKYSDKRKDWQKLCWSCHTKYDYKHNGRRNQHMVKNDLLKKKTLNPF